MSTVAEAIAVTLNKVNATLERVRSDFSSGASVHMVLDLGPERPLTALLKVRVRDHEFVAGTSERRFKFESAEVGKAKASGRNGPAKKSRPKPAPAKKKAAKKTSRPNRSAKTKKR